VGCDLCEQEHIHRLFIDDCCITLTTEISANGKLLTFSEEVDAD
jgi:hypothetical protein